MAADGTPIREIAWRDLFPWVIIGRSFRVAMDPRKVLVCSAGLILMWAGWWFAYQMFKGSESVQTLANHQVAVPGWNQSLPAGTNEQPTTWLDQWVSLWYETWWSLSSPFVHIFRADVTVTQLAFLLICGLWGLAVWSLFGGTVSRMAAAELTCEESMSTREAFSHALKHWLSYFSGPVFPLLGVVGILIPMIVLGLLMNFGFGTLLAGILWPLQLLAALLAAILLVGLLVSWPLMWPTVAVEGGDAFESLSRAYGYSMQRPVQYAFYAIVGGVIGLISWTLVRLFAAIVVSLAAWGASWGSGGDDMANILATGPDALKQMATQFGAYPEADTAEEVTGLSYAGAMVLSFWVWLVYIAATAYGFAYLWSASTAIYLVLRRDVDGAEFDEFFRDNDDDEYGLPDLTEGPRLADEPGPSPKDESSESEPATETSDEKAEGESEADKEEQDAEQDDEKAEDESDTEKSEGDSSESDETDEENKSDEEKSDEEAGSEDEKKD